MAAQPSQEKSSMQNLIESLLDSETDSDNDSQSDSDNEHIDESSEESDEYSEDSDESNNEASESTSERIPPMVQKKKNDWIWTETDNEPIVYPFSKDNGISADILEKYKSEIPSELSIFLKFMEPLFENISKETNAYAELQLGNSKRKRLKDDAKWYETTPDEIKVYFALIILMSQVRKSRIQLYWSKDRCIDTPIFRETMSRTRFNVLSRFLHFADNMNEDQNDKLRKIRPIIQHLTAKFSEIHTPSENIALDESLMKFRGRLPFVQCNRTKRARFGIKFYKICDSNSGYCQYFKIYVGDDVTDSNLPASTNVVLNLMEPLLDSGHTLFLDSWYSSPDLFKRLTERKTNVIGTVRPNRKNMPYGICKKKLQRGEYQQWSANNIMCLRWRDQKDVYFLSTKHKTAEILQTGKFKRKRGQTPREFISKPKCALEYQSGMGGVDLQDQVTALFPIMRRTVKGYRKIFFYLLDMCIFNSFTVYYKLTEKKKTSYGDFKVNLARQILESVQLPEYSVRGRPSSSTTPLRLQAKSWAHFPQHIPPTDSKKNATKRCVVCTSRGKRSETVWQCKKCGVALHLETCFEVYHTQQEY